MGSGRRTQHAGAKGSWDPGCILAPCARTCLCGAWGDDFSFDAGSNGLAVTGKAEDQEEADEELEGPDWFIC